MEQETETGGQMTSTRLKVILSPLAVEYREMKKRAARGGERSKELAAVRSAAPEGEDRVTLSSDHSPLGAAGVSATRSRPVTPEERQALMQAFSILA
jgi:hypothetical protein